MMADECWPLEQLAELARLPAGDPRLDHLARCPRCRARLAGYRAFIAGEPAEGADPAAADAALGDFLARELAPPGARRRRPSIVSLLTTPAVWPVLAAAAVLLLAVGLWRAEAPRPGAGGPPVLRGEATTGPAPVPLAVRPLPDGRLQFSWRRQAGADAYRLVLYRADLSELARADAAADTSLASDGRGARYWRVIALRGGDEIGRSAAVPLRGR